MRYSLVIGMALWAQVSSTTTITNREIPDPHVGMTLVQFTMGNCDNKLIPALPMPGEDVEPVCYTSQSNGHFGMVRFHQDKVGKIRGHFTLPDYVHNPLTHKNDGQRWDGRLEVSGKWLSWETQGDVVWQMRSGCGSELPTTSNSARDVTKAIALQFNNFSIIEPSTANCLPGWEFYFEFFRDPYHSADILNGPADLISLTFGYGWRSK